MYSITWLRKYPVDTLQIYFAASLELQEELIKHGFRVPASRDKKVIMPIPLIYSNFRGWLKPPPPLTCERLIPLEWLGLTPQQLGWVETKWNKKKAYILPREEVYVNLGIRNDDSIFLNLEIKGYHLERTSIRMVNPEKWTNWAMLYINVEYIDDLINTLEAFLPSSYNSMTINKKPYRELQQRGKEVTYYVEVPVKDFSFCLGCFDLAKRYLIFKAQEHCLIDPDSLLCRDPLNVFNNLKLRLTYSRSLMTFAKVGVAKISGKRPQIMVKLASGGPKISISGVLKDRIEGKKRGELIDCKHAENKQYMALDLLGFYQALKITQDCINELPKEE